LIAIKEGREIDAEKLIFAALTLGKLLANVQKASLPTQYKKR
jgi:hypothetical protein